MSGIATIERTGTAPATVTAELLADRDAAALCGIGRSTWRRLYATGKTPAAVHLGGAVRWRRQELMAWGTGPGCPPLSCWTWKSSE